MKVCRGTYHQGCTIFAPFAGVQCTAVAFIFLLLSMGNHVPQRNLLPQDIDNILFEGTALYAHIVTDMGVYQQAVNNTFYLAHQHLPSTVAGIPVNAQFHYDAFFGVMGQNGDSQIGTMHIYDSLIAASHVSPFMLYTAANRTIALVVDHNENNYVVFDSHERKFSERLNL